MRTLFTTIPASGHFHPLVPLARAAINAGHEVAFAASAPFCPDVEAAGFRCFPAGVDRLGGQHVTHRLLETRRHVGHRHRLAGPVVVHTGGVEHFSELIRGGYVQAVLSGKATPEAAMTKAQQEADALMRAYVEQTALKGPE